jgi:CheY-like chemotaxis protein
MPVMSGLEAMIYIREKLISPKSNVPIIALTAHNPGMFIEECSEAGFNQMLVKPYSIDKIAELLETYKKS